MNKNRKMTKRTTDYILTFCNELRKEIKRADLGLDIWEKVDKAYITQTMLSGIYNVLINEGYTKRDLDNYFFFEGEINKHKKQTEQACKLYHTDLEIKPGKKIVRCLHKLPDYVNKNREMTPGTIDYILNFCRKLSRAREKQEYDEEYMLFRLLSFAYTILLKEGYDEEHLSEWLFYDGFDPDDIAYKTYPEWRKHIALEDERKIIEKFFNSPRGRKLKREINKLKFNQ